MGVACADCIILILELKVLMATCSKFGLMLKLAMMTWTIVCSLLSPSDWDIFIVVSIKGLRGC